MPLIYGQCSCDLYNRFFVWPPCISAQLSAICRTEVRILLKIPGFTRISWQAFSTRCNNVSKSLIAAEYTEVPIAKDLEDEGQRIVQDIWLDLRVLSTVYWKSCPGTVWQRGGYGAGVPSSLNHTSCCTCSRNTGKLIAYIHSSDTVLLRCRNFHFSLDISTIGRTPWASDRPVARPLPK
jgi:hypothetical protein